MTNQKKDYLRKDKKDDDTFKINHSFVHSYQYPPSYGEKNSQDSIQTFSNNRLTRENATSNQLKNVENTDLNSYILQNNNPIIDSGNWYAVKLSDGRTVYKINSTNGQYFSLSTNNHLTSDPSQAYSGPINFVDSTVTITNGATISGSNFLLIKNSPSNNSAITINTGGTLQDSNIFNQNVTMNGGSSTNNTFISSPVIMNGSSTSDNDSFLNPNTTRSGYNLGGQSFSGNSYKNQPNSYFQSSDNNTANLTLNNNSKVTNPNIPDLYRYNPSSNRLTVSVSRTAQFSQEQITGDDIENYVKNYNISNDHINIIGTGGTTSIYISSEIASDPAGNMIRQNVYKNGAGIIIYRGNDPVNIFNINNIYIQDGAVVDGAEIFANNSWQNVFIQKGGTLKNSKFYDGYIGIEQGGKSINNTYFSPEFSSNGHYIDGLSQNDTIYETSWSASGKLNIANNNNICLNGNNPPVYNQTNNNPPPNQSIWLTNGLTRVTVGTTGQFINPTINTNHNYSIDYVPGLNTDNPQPCYLCGTMIETRDGLKAIEKIRAGDMVYTYEGSARVLKPVTWVGSGHHSVRRNRPDDVAGYAIHIVKDALADNIPYKDMRITPEHCLYIDEKFIPARMLVNHHSIRYDYSKTEYTYYHLELEEHGVIKADGVLSESYLNTDNHKNFHNPEKVVQLRQETKDWAQDAAAPLETSREAVEPVHAHLKQRALHLGMKNMVAPETITHSTNLHIITDKGEVIHPQWPVTGNGNYVFVLPSPVHHVHIISNSSRPCDAIGPFVDDRRNLGVLIETITLFDNRENHYVKAHLETKKLEGWHNQENIPCRWTDGYALLPLDQHVLQKGRKILTVKVIAAGPYISQNQLDHKNQLRN